MKRTLIIHPFLFAIFPILFLYSHNKNVLPINIILKPIIIIVCISLFCWLILTFIIKNNAKSALLVALFFLLFFSYGHFLNLMQGFYTLLCGYIIDCNLSVLIVWGLLFISGILFTVKTSKKLHNLTNVLNVVATSLVIISLIDIGIFELKKTRVVRQGTGLEHGKPKSIDREDLRLYPNIYYIILDGYARADVLEEIYNYDNTEFLDYLKSKGFYVASKSRANYTQTILSLASAFNLKYLDDLVDLDIEADDRMPLKDFIEDNEVMYTLKEHGYAIVLFDTWIMEELEIKNVDFYITKERSDFEDMLIRTTPLSLLLKILRKNPYAEHRKRLLYVFDHLADVCYLNPPIFAFTHILLPHPPFVFTEDGEEIEPNRDFVYYDPFIRKGEDIDEYLKNYKTDYIGQLIFLNNRLKDIIDYILAHSPNPPIIILQADHGPASTLVDEWRIKNDDDYKERMSIFNAYYLPDSGYIYLYEDITPVNTFRIIFNHYFGTDYELLKDESYFSTWFAPYKLINVTDKVNSDTDTKLPE